MDMQSILLKIYCDQHDNNVRLALFNFPTHFRLANNSFGQILFPFLNVQIQRYDSTTVEEGINIQFESFDIFNQN